MQEDATEHIDSVLERVKPEYLRRAYKLKSWTDSEDFLSQVARHTGKLGKGGEPDLNTAAKMVLHDWQRGKIPFFTLPADYSEEAKPSAAANDNKTTAAAGDITEADPEAVARASEALEKEATTIVEKQTKGSIPVQHGFYNPVDLGDDAEEIDNDSDDEIASGSDDGSEGSDDSGSDEEAEESDEEDDDELDLSWEAVMAAVQPSKQDDKKKKGAAADKKRKR